MKSFISAVIIFDVVNSNQDLAGYRLKMVQRIVALFNTRKNSRMQKC